MIAASGGRVAYPEVSLAGAGIVGPGSHGTDDS